jgi:hypothetical protein
MKHSIYYLELKIAGSKRSFSTAWKDLTLDTGQFMIVLREGNKIFHCSFSKTLNIKRS